ncbi:hydroxymethylglutaryl-CoA synthase 1-like [Watersipora subatra]|uniref:hydroxymethylglutaryl-CoA synthase 1-like n=1 Tax=Watersipora subatra TaxID=2589382 RepID=UPI00355AF9C2
MPGTKGCRIGWPEDVGITAMEVYFPSQYVDQTELEQFDGISAGKYTIGLGQEKMGFCSDREDVHSLALTVVKNLMLHYDVKPTEIGRIEVGTETIIDKSKSVKTVLMQLFQDSGNTDVEGIDTTNACYGGTNALFNSVNWVESSSWDGRYALVVCSDIAVYATGPARCTGGAGAVAMLIGPDAAVVLDRGVRSSHMEHSYDFYKPNLDSEYPVVDGKLSIQCYLGALDKCYQRFKAKASATFLEGSTFTLADADGFCFHSPYCKLVQKSVARLLFNDFLAQPDKPEYDHLQAFREIKLEDSYFNKDVEKAFMTASQKLFEQKTRPALLLANQVGNMYTPSVYANLCSYITGHTAATLTGKRAVLFSFGSGLASSMYSVKFSSNISPDSPLAKLTASLSDLPQRLESRQKVDPSVFSEALKLREETHHLAPYTPVGDTAVLFPGTFYLTSIDDKYRREYAIANGGSQLATTSTEPAMKKLASDTPITNGDPRPVNA